MALNIPYDELKDLYTLLMRGVDRYKANFDKVFTESKKTKRETRDAGRTGRVARGRNL